MADAGVGIGEAGAAVVRACRRLDARGLIAGLDGNVSVRLADGTLLVTPAGRPKHEVGEDELVRCGADGTVISGGHPSSEFGMHLALYAARPDVRAVVHAHPPTATGFAVAGETIAGDALPEVIFQVGEVALVPFALPGTPALAEALAPFARGHDAFLLANHGATTVGPTLGDALQRMESLEHAARILLAARQVGAVRRLGESDRAALRAARERARGTG